MNKINKVIKDPFFQAVVGDRGLRMYRTPVDGRLGMTGLSKLVKKITGEDPKLSEAYGFLIKNRNMVKIITKDEISTNILVLQNSKAEQAKELFVELGLM